MNNYDKLKNHPAIQPIKKNKIYIYQHIGVAKHDGYLKIGKTIRTSNERIDQQNLTPDIDFEILAEFDAIDINGNIFEDKDIHKELSAQGYQRTKNQKGNPTEWFKISLDEITDVINNRINCRNEWAHLKNAPTIYKLRPNQQKAVEKTYMRWKIAMETNNPPISLKSFLWNAKPRFGKTLTAYEFAQKINAKKVLIITQRTAISDSWYEDYNTWIQPKTSYKFGSTKNNTIEDSLSVYSKAYSRSQSEKIAQDSNSKLFFYISFSDIKGKNKQENREFKTKNKWIFNTKWDLLIIDETHEGSDTDYAYNVYDGLKYDFVLHLSGTPFKKMASNTFSDVNTFTWSYAEEQEAKENWDYNNGPNPYADMPKMNIFTYQISPEIRRAMQTDEQAFDFTEFFKISNGKFVHDEDIDKFLDNLSAAKDNDTKNNQFYPFADKDTRDVLRHTFWMLPKQTKIAELLKDKLDDEKRHPFFKDYEIIVAAGSKNKQTSSKALKEVHEKISDKPWKTKTITLSVDMLKTGTTVKPWTAVMMLNNSSDAQGYIQTAFRAQTPWKYEINNQPYIKDNCYVFDFAPDRILKVFEEYANLEANEPGILIDSNRIKNLKILLNYLPIISIDSNNTMKYLEAREVLNMSNNLKAREVVEDGFMSNSLFTIGGLFRASDLNPRLAEIMNRMDPVKNKKVQRNAEEVEPREYKEGVSEEFEDDNGIKKEIVISTNGMGQKQFVEIETIPETGEISETILNIPISDDGTIDTDGLSEKSKKAIEKANIEFEKEKEKQKTDAEKIRDRLRGFSRTIPMFLMAYGKPTTTLDNFDKFVSSEVFTELAGITPAEFAELRDANLFDETVFNAAIREFLKKKQMLGRYFEQDENDDIFNYIPPQRNNQIFTPKQVINRMLDILEKENPGIFKSTKIKFLDPQMKSGQYITEIAKRLYKYSHDKDIYRILSTQLYGFAPTEVLTHITHEMILGFVRHETDDSKRKQFYNLQKNFQHRNLIPIISQSDSLKNTIIESFGEDMKFDVIIGNPPYQEETKDTSDKQIYPYFMDEAYKTSKIVCMITPARFLFNAGKTSKKWNEKMLNDKHLKVEYYEQDSSKVFPNTDIKGGVTITYRDENRDFGIIGTYTHFEELNKILQKIKKYPLISLSSIYYSTDSYSFTKNMHEDFPTAKKALSKGHEKTVASSVFTTLENIFTNQQFSNDDIKFIGVVKNQRQYRYIKNIYIEDHPNLNKYKVILPGSNGSGSIGEVLSTPLIGTPLIGTPLMGHTQTFISFGAFDNEIEAQNLMKYIKTKFARTLLGVLKITQSNKKSTWKYVPIQDFTENSDINWSKPIPEIDQQLYKKYGLDQNEIDFIESKVREME